jgi:hypothetical protein
LTELARVDGDSAVIDGSIPGNHATCTASKALGAQFGISKRSTLIVVKLADSSLLEFFCGLTEIIEDLAAHPERRKRSVVTVSLSGPTFDTDEPYNFVHSALVSSIILLDVPVVVSAGNDGNKPGRSRVDTVPAMFAGETLPLIVVGATNSDGTLWLGSQTGPQVTLNAIGEDVGCAPPPQVDKWSGTSFASAMVAGEIANLLSYDTVPFDTSDGNLVMNLRNYLGSDAASWERTPGIRMLWNGVTEANNPPSQVQVPTKEDRNISAHIGRRLVIARG